MRLREGLSCIRPTRVCTIGLLSAAIALPSTAGAEAFSPPGPNVALHRSYTLDPRPNYQYCTDAGDATQLTDGQYASQPGSLWVQPGCVGWQRPSLGPHLVTITLDMGEIVSIAGLSFSTAAGSAGVGWPAAILILVSDDGANFHYVGELCSLSAKFGVPAPEGYQEHRFCTDRLRTHGRFVRLGVAVSGPYLFCDEIEVYRGPDEMLALPLEGPIIADLGAFVSQHRTALSIRNWIATDVVYIRQAIVAAAVGADVRQWLNEKIAAIQKANEACPNDPPADYRAIYPLTANHGHLGEVVARLRRAEGYPSLLAWHNNRWEHFGPWDLPPKGPGRSPTLTVRMMANEIRAETLNIANFGDSPLDATLRFTGLPGGQAPEYITMHKAEYVAMQSGRWDADALPVVPRSSNGWQVRLLPGISQQLWMSFHPQDLPCPGRYLGAVLVEIPSTGQKLKSLLRLIIEPLRFPDEPTLALGMWDYTDGGGQYD